MRGAIGIDFGTTNTLCAWMDGTTPVIVPNDLGDRSTPSAVALSEAGDILVGVPARNRAMADPASTLIGVKRSLGKVPLVELGGRSFEPEALAAAVMAKVRRDAERYLGFEVDRAVLTVPARFSDPQRRAVREAARRAGLTVARVMNEPTAAALARAWAAPGTGDERRLLVYDFGGGTFDATVLLARKGSCRVLASDGDDALGGMDLDRALYRRVAARFRDGFGIDPDADPFLSRTLVDLCERAKMELSVSESAVVAVPFLTGPTGVVHPSVRVTREEFEADATPFVERTLELVRRTMRAAGSGAVDALVLSGGSSRIPLVARKLAGLVGVPPDARVNPGEIVAAGAAIEAARIEGRVEGLSFTDVCSRTFGIEIEGGRFVPIIRKNEPLPAAGRRLFTTVEDYQRSVELHVLQGESERTEGDASVGRFLLPGVRAARKGEPRIRVDFAIDECDMLRVRARDMDTKAEQTVAFFDGGADSLPPVERALSLADRARREAASLRLDAALAAELAELRDAATACAKARDEGEAGRVAQLLEGLIVELAARAGTGSSAAAGDTGGEG